MARRGVGLSQTEFVARQPCIVAIEDLHGEPLGHVRFVVQSAPEPVPEMAYVTDSIGRASLGLPFGDIVLRLFLADGAPRDCALRVSGGTGRTYVLKVAR